MLAKSWQTLCLVLLSSFAYRSEGFESPENELLKISKRSRLNMADNFVGSHCSEAMEVTDRTIIRIKDSEKLGAKFLNQTVIVEFEFCLKHCCDTPYCNLAVWDNEEGNCFLFDCGTPEDFLCRFDPSDTYSTGALLINRHLYDERASRAHDNHANQLKALGSARQNKFEELLDEARELEEELANPRVQDERNPKANSPPAQVQGPMENKVTCSPFESMCKNGLECIAVYDQCNGIPQCSDGSDEDPSVCPQLTTAKPKTQPKKATNLQVPPQPARTADVNLWGREGELSKNGNSAFRQNQQQIMMGPQQQQPLVPQGQWNVPQYGYPPQGGYQVNPYQNGYPQYQGNQGYYPGYQPQNIPPPPQGQQIQQVVTPVTNPPPKSEAKTAKPKIQKTKTTKQPQPVTSKPRGTTLHPDSFENHQQLKKAILLEELGDEDFVMESDVAAVFTLIMGCLLSMCLCAVMCCKMQSGRRARRKRNRHSDGEGDYLVNGMYL